MQSMWLDPSEHEICEIAMMNLESMRCCSFSKRKRALDRIFLIGTVTATKSERAWFTLQTMDLLQTFRTSNRIIIIPNLTIEYPGRWISNTVHYLLRVCVIDGCLPMTFCLIALKFLGSVRFAITDPP